MSLSKLSKWKEERGSTWNLSPRARVEPDVCCIVRRHCSHGTIELLEAGALHKVAAEKEKELPAPENGTVLPVDGSMETLGKSAMTWIAQMRLLHNAVKIEVTLVEIQLVPRSNPPVCLMCIPDDVLKHLVAEQVLRRSGTRILGKALRLK
ncbi:hypothetical protein DIPPA_61222 [Diplonema papillatum]|nr:hypothetical protein DIPPA_61222 [Diplonema papillatum]